LRPTGPPPAPGSIAVERIPYAITRYVNETNRLYGVLDRRLAAREYLAGEAYSIADMATYLWVVPWKRQQQRLDGLDDFPNPQRWFDAFAIDPSRSGPMHVASLLHRVPR